MSLIMNSQDWKSWQTQRPRPHSWHDTTEEHPEARDREKAQINWGDQALTQITTRAQKYFNNSKTQYAA